MKRNWQTFKVVYDVNDYNSDVLVSFDLNEVVCYSDRLNSVSVGLSNGHVWYIDCGYEEFRKILHNQEFNEKFDEYLEDKK